MPRFVVLTHDWPKSHLDLFIERDGVLKAWRLPADFDPSCSTTAVATSDHRLHYLDYEGPVSDNRGTVARWDAGEAKWETIKPDWIAVRFDGTRLTGRYELIRRDDAMWELQSC